MELQAVMAGDVVLELQLEMKFFGNGFQNIDRDSHGFRANTVAGQNNNFHGVNSNIED
jgi:hypothetical protein